MNMNECFPKILTNEHVNERLRSVFQTLGNIFTVSDLSGFYRRRRGAKKFIMVSLDEIEIQESFDV